MTNAHRNAGSVYCARDHAIPDPLDPFGCAALPLQNRSKPRTPPCHHCPRRLHGPMSRVKNALALTKDPRSNEAVKTQAATNNARGQKTGVLGTVPRVASQSAQRLSRTERTGTQPSHACTLPYLRLFDGKRTHKSATDLPQRAPRTYFRHTRREMQQTAMAWPTSHAKSALALAMDPLGREAAKTQAATNNTCEPKDLRF